MELKKSVDVYVANAASKIDNNVTSLVNMQKKNNYLLDLSESVLNHENQYEILKLSQYVIIKFLHIITNNASYKIDLF